METTVLVRIHAPYRNSMKKRKSRGAQSSGNYMVTTCTRTIINTISARKGCLRRYHPSGTRKA
ncbi:hypothetical protein [Thermoplasma volcanium]|uniref:hypothetical protein n=1 Tax=Thermoplasma volcanium TaxID=50339 RepID=UPI0012EACE11|nr:hypothetical protein [Thermoplasma volcanium]